MNLLKQIIALTEEDTVEKIAIEQLWKDNTIATGLYVGNDEYQVRLISKPDEPKKYEAFKLDGYKRKPFGKFGASELADVLEPIRANQKPDAEGFTNYRGTEQVEAFKYSGEPKQVVVDGEIVKLRDGDFCLRKAEGSKFVYFIETASYFESSFVKK